jgi:hypothetical protein
MRHDYSDPVARLLDYGGFDIRQIEEPWPDYLELGFAEEHVPELIRMATDSDLNNADQDNLEVWAPLHAWRTLGQLRAVEAAKPLVHLLEQLRHDDWLPIDLRKVFSLIGPLSVPAIAEFMANRSIEEICRVSVPACLEQIAHDYPDHRNECVGVLAHQLSFYATNGTDLNAFLVMSLANLKASETIDLIRKAFAADCVELTLQGDVEDVEIEMGLRAVRDTPPPDLSLFPGLPRLDLGNSRAERYVQKPAQTDWPQRSLSLRIGKKVQEVLSSLSRSDEFEPQSKRWTTESVGCRPAPNAAYRRMRPGLQGFMGLYGWLVF